MEAEGDAPTGTFTADRNLLGNAAIHSLTVTANSEWPQDADVSTQTVTADSGTMQANSIDQPNVGSADDEDDLPVRVTTASDECPISIEEAETAKPVPKEDAANVTRGRRGDGSRRRGKSNAGGGDAQKVRTLSTHCAHQLCIGEASRAPSCRACIDAGSIRYISLRALC